MRASLVALAALLGVGAGWAAAGGPSDVRAAAARCDRPGDPAVACVRWQAPGSGEAVSGVLGGDACSIDVVYGSIRITDIRFSVSGRSLNTRTQKPYACDWNTREVENGRYTLKASVRFENGETKEDEVAVQVRNSSTTTDPPTTTVTIGGGTTTIVDQRPRDITRIASTISTEWLAYRRHTVVRRLGVEDVPAGAAVSLRCRGGGCRFRSRRIVVRGRARDVRLNRYFTRDRLRPGTQIDIRITKRGAVGKLVRYTMLRNALPRRSTACLSAASGRRIGCR